MMTQLAKRARGGDHDQLFDPVCLYLAIEPGRDRGRMGIFVELVAGRVTRAGVVASARSVIVFFQLRRRQFSEFRRGLVASIAPQLPVLAIDYCDDGAMRDQHWTELLFSSLMRQPSTPKLDGTMRWVKIGAGNFPEASPENSPENSIVH